MKTTSIYTLLLVAVFMVQSCEPLENVSDVPEIHFLSFSEPYYFESGGVPSYAADLSFSFIDGDSDIGVIRSSGTDTVNLVFIPFQKAGGLYDSVDAELYGQKFTIKNDERLDRDGRTVKGEITVQILYFLKPPFDTLRYDFYLLDRAGNKSNVETTSDIAF